MGTPASNNFVQENIGFLQEWQKEHFIVGNVEGADATGAVMAFMDNMDKAGAPHEQILDAVEVIGNYADTNFDNPVIKAEMIEKTLNSYEKIHSTGAGHETTLKLSGVSNPEQYRGKQFETEQQLSSLSQPQAPGI